MGGRGKIKGSLKTDGLLTTVSPLITPVCVSSLPFCATTATTYTWLIIQLENLPGAFTVWAASKEASFLHGRYVFSSWDVEELANTEITSRLAKDRDYLKISVKGLDWMKKI